jgi:hypothetical protein
MMQIFDFQVFASFLKNYQKNEKIHLQKSGRKTALLYENK